MLIGKDSKYLLKKTRSRAKMYEFNIPPELHILVEEEANNLLLIAIAAIGDISANVLNKETAYRTVPKERKEELEFASRYFDAFFQSKLDTRNSQYYMLLGSIAYYFCDYIGSAKVMAGMIAVENLDLNCNRIDKFLILLLQDKLDSVQVVIEDSIYAEYLYKVQEAYIDHFVKFHRANTMFVKEFRSIVYAQGTPRELLLSDALLAILFLKMGRSAIALLPEYTQTSTETWVKMLRSQKNLKELWPAQIQLGEAGVFSGNSGIIQMPTSSGKTTSISIIVRSAFVTNKTSLAVVVAPFRALCREISSDLANNFADDNSVLVNELSDVLELDQSLNFSDFFDNDNKTILVLTPEKLLYILRQEPDFYQSIGLIIFDEAHMFDDSSRGARYELLLASINMYLEPGTQKLLISAVIPNAEELNHWFTGSEGVVISDSSIRASEKSIAFCDWDNKNRSYGYLYYIDSNDINQEDFYVPRVVSIVPLNKLSNREGQRTFPQVDFNTSKVEYNDMAIYLANKLVDNGGVAVFCGTKTSADNILKRIIEIETRGIDISSFEKNTLNSEHLKIAHLIQENYSSDCLYFEAANRGLFCHHRGISNGIRISVEYAMKEELIQVVICTSTLAQGVNLPIRYLIISSIYQANERIKVRDFHNLIGRAGRAGVFTEGTVILSEPFVYSNRKVRKMKWRWERYKKLLDSSNSESCISELLNLVRPVMIQISYNENWTLNFLPLIKMRYQNMQEYDYYLQKLLNDFDSAYPNKESDLKKIISKIDNCLSAIESYMLEHDFTWEDMDLIIENTLGFHLASEEERKDLRDLFHIIEAYLNSEVDSVNKRSAFSRTMLSVETLKQLESWVQDNFGELLACNNLSDLISMVVPQILHHTDNKTLQALITTEKLTGIVKLWTKGAPYSTILKYTDEQQVLILRRKKPAQVQLGEVIELCDMAFGYSAILIINAISELICLSSDDVPAVCQGLTVLARQFRYGLDSEESILIYEIGFSDRVIAQEIEKSLPKALIHSKKQMRELLKHNKDSIAELLSNYPSIFTYRLSKL